MASLGFDVDASIAHKNRGVDPMRVARGELDETGEYDLNGLFIRPGYAIDSMARNGWCWASGILAGSARVVTRKGNHR